MDEENEEVSGSEMMEQNSSEQNETSVASEVKNEAAEKVKEKVSQEAIKKVTANPSLLAPIIHILAWLALILIIIIIAVGIVVFLVTMPGMVMEQLKAIIKEIGNAIASAMGHDSAELKIDDQKVYDTMDTLKNMGYDLKGYGFLTKFYDEAEDGNTPDNGVLLDSSGKIAKAESAFLNLYYYSDNYSHIIKNFNMVTQSNNKSANWFDNIINGIYGAMVSFSNYMDPIVDILMPWADGGNTDEAERYGTGLLSIYEEQELGIRGEFWGHDFTDDIMGNSMKVEGNDLVIKNGKFLKKNIEFKYNLDGWVGRYGMPLDFLLSVHLATMMPDLAADMVTNFDTEIEILLHKTDKTDVHTAYRAERDTYYKTKDEQVSIEAENGYIERDTILKYIKEADSSIVDDVLVFFGGENFCSDAAAMNAYVKSGMMDPRTKEVDDENNPGQTKTIPKCSHPNSKTTTSYGDSTASQEFLSGGLTIEELKEYINAGGNTTFQGQAMDANFPPPIKTDDFDSEFDIDEHTTLPFGYDTLDDDGNIAYVEMVLLEYTDDEWNKIRSEEILKKAQENDIRIEEEKDGETISRPIEMIDILTGEGVYPVPYDKWEMITTDVNNNKVELLKSKWDGKTIGDLIQKIKKDNENYEYVAEENSNGIDDLKPHLMILPSHSETNPDAAEIYCWEVPADEISNYKLCPSCKAYFNKIITMLRNNTYEGYETYSPYINKVNNHWFRDVFFSTRAGSMTEIQNDSDYERITNERWTLYYKYQYEKGSTEGTEVKDKSDGTEKVVAYYTPDIEKDGEYVLFRSDTGVRYPGTQKDADNEGVKVEKKPIPNVVNKGWMAYTLSDNKSKNWKHLYDEPEPDGWDIENSLTDAVESAIYIKVNKFGDVKQVEDGKRGETNQDIKDMFTKNQYFRYDGTPETAEAISIMRGMVSGGVSEKTTKGQMDDVNSYYGRLNRKIDTFNTENTLYDNLENIKVIVELESSNSLDESESENNNDSETDKKVYTRDDVVGTVSLNKDSLAAFSMLENTHTKDADFIYKDFKELVVELGYFTKEELSDNPPRLLEFPVPDLGSYGYPIRSLDKRETEEGTFLHSQEDYKKNTKNTLAAYLAEITGEPENPPEAEEESNKDESSNIIEPENPPEAVDSKVSIKSNEFNIIGQVASIKSTPIHSLKTVGKIAEVPYVDYKCNLVGKNGGMGDKIADIEFNGINYEGWFQDQIDTCTLFSFAFVASVYSGEPVTKFTKDDRALYWKPGLDGSCWETAGIAGTYYRDHKNDNVSIGTELPGIEESKEMVSQALSEGKPVWFYSGLGSGEGWHAIVLLGASTEGKIVYYDPWDGITKEYGSQLTFSENFNTLFNSGVNMKGGRLHGYFIPDQVPNGVIMGGGNSFSGFRGNEAVVSPVTGILLEYGTYGVDEKGNPVEGEEKYRRNIDASKDGTNIVNQDNNEEANEEQENEESTSQEEKTNNNYYDKVGYAKILVMDEEHMNLMVNSDGKLTANTDISVNHYDMLQVAKDKYNEAKIAFDNDRNSVINNKNKDKFASIQSIDYNSIINDTFEEFDLKYEEEGSFRDDLAGYKLFYEDYEDYGIAGYIVYIDGFKCELPEEQKDEEDTDEDSGSLSSADETSDSQSENDNQKYDGYDLSMGQFRKWAKEIKMTKPNPNEEPDPDNPDPQSKYEKDESYKMEDGSTQVKQDLYIAIKDQTSPLYFVDDGTTDGLIYIKEGTVIGRTYSDEEVVEVLRGEKIDDYKVSEDTDTGTETNEDNGSEDTKTENIDSNSNEDEARLVGNYLRIQFRNLDDEIVENVEDYMKLDEPDGSENHSEIDMEFFYWLPYESGPLEDEGNGPAAAGTVSGPTEIACGIAQWTTTSQGSGCNNIPELCKWLVNKSSFCNSLNVFTSYSTQQMLDNQNDFFDAWHAIAAEHWDEFFELQTEYFYETQFKSWIDDGYAPKWILDRPMVVQGTLASLLNWATNNIWWNNALAGCETKSDEEVIKALLKEANNHDSTVGPLTPRWESQAKLGVDIVNGTFTDVQGWIKTKQPSTYGEGANSGYLVGYLLTDLNSNKQYAYLYLKKFLGKYRSV